MIGIVAAEFALLRPGIAGARLGQLARVDGAYGALAGLVIIAGFGRVFFGVNGAGYYLGNHVFWGKMGLFVIVGLLSIQPTLTFLRWRKALKTDPTFAPPSSEIASSRRFLHLQIAGLALIPMFAAAMARGYGAS